MLPAARQHFNSNVEAVDDGDIVVIWAEWDKSKLDGGSHAVEPLIGRTEVLVVAEGRWDQSAILSMVWVELDLPAPLGKDPVACGQWSCAATASGSCDYCSSRNTPPFLRLITLGPPSNSHLPLLLLLQPATRIASASTTTTTQLPQHEAGTSIFKP